MPGEQRNGAIDMFLPAPLRGSGGHRTAVAAAEHLAGSGYDVRLHFAGAAVTGQAELDRQARQWHGVQRASVHAGWPRELPDSSAVIATTWLSAAVVGGVRTTAVRMHFVQDYEAWFHPMGDEFLAASGVHDAGLRTIVIGRWLQHVLLGQHQLPSWSVPFTADPALYRPLGEPAEGPPTVVAMYQPDKPRRCGHLMRAALQQVLSSDPDVRVITVGSRHSPELGPRHRHLSVVPHTELPGLYARATVGFSISASNPSRVPFEMMATGLPVVELGRGNNLYDLPDSGCVLAHPDPASLASALLAPVRDPALRSALSQGGLAFMADRPSAREGGAFGDAVAAAIAGEVPPTLEVEPLYRSAFHQVADPVAWDGRDGSDGDAPHPATLAPKPRSAAYRWAQRTKRRMAAQRRQG